MKKIFDVNVEEHKLSLEKITINIKNWNMDNFSEIKCFKNFEEVNSLEARKINLIKIQKTIFLNLFNLLHIDFRDNKLLKISKHFKGLKNIKTIKLDDNSISYIPSFIGSLELLETFTICNNKIKYLPTSIQYLQKLKTLKLSNNQITTIPIEFGLLKVLECLYIDANHFTEIPTTFCYLKHLSEFGFEWFEFLDPPFQKVIKESIGKTIISLTRNSLQEMIKQNFLYCDMMTFIKRNSNSTSRRESNSKLETVKLEEINFNKRIEFNGSNKKINCHVIGDKVLMSSENDTKEIINLNQKKLMKIFYAIENNYYGVIKALISSNKDYLTIKNGDNKTPLYLSIQNNKNDITNLLLTHIDFTKISNSHIYLHKAIRMRDPVLTEKFLNMGIDINSADDQGATCFHVLFSSFNRQFYKCSVIGDILLRKNCKLNALNNDSWAPVHIAARRSAKECIEWIITQNKVLRSLGRETFDLNLRGKNRWTPLHLSVNGFRLEETMLLLEAGCDIFARNSDGKLPRKVANGNFLLTKLLRNYEIELLSNKYLNSEKKDDFVYNRFTTVEDTSHIENNDESNSFMKTKGQNSVFLSAVLSEEISKSASHNESQNTISFKNNTNKTIHKILKLNESSIELFSKDKKSGKSVSNEMIPLIKENMNSNSNNSNLSKYKPKETPKFTQINSVDFHNKFKKNLIPAPNKSTVKPNRNQLINRKNTTLNNNNKSSSSHAEAQYSNAYKKVNKVNLHFHKEVILNPESSLAEKYESLMFIKLSHNMQNPLEIENIIKSILEAIDLDSNINMIIFVDVLDLIIVNKYFDLISFLEMMQRSIEKKSMNRLVDKELTNTINVLKSVHESFKKTILINEEVLLTSSATNSVRRREKMLNKNVKVPNANKPYTFENVGKIKKHTISSVSNSYKMVNSTPKVNHFTMYFDTENNKQGNDTLTKSRNDEFNYNEMNEMSKSYIDFNNYNKPKNFIDLEKIQSNNYTIDDESCNIADSSWSVTKFDDNNNEGNNEPYLNTHQSNYSRSSKTEDVKCDTMKPDDDLFSIIPPKKIDTSFFDIENNN